MTTTDIEPAKTTTDLAVRATDRDLDRAARLGMWLAAAESGSKDPKALGMAAALRIAYAESLGLPAHAASEVHVINGNLSLSAKLLRAKAYEYGLRLVNVKETPDSCTAAVVDTNGVELGRRTFTLAMAAARGLTGRPNWKSMPDRMLWARASKQALDDCAPWVTVGVMLDDEAQEMEPPQPIPFDGDAVLEGEVEE